MCFVEDLYYGNIHPWEMKFGKESEYAKQLRIICDNEKILLQKLKGKELELFNELAQARDKMCGISELENFKIGFRLGARLIYASINEENSTLKQI